MIKTDMTKFSFFKDSVNKKREYVHPSDRPKHTCNPC